MKENFWNYPLIRHHKIYERTRSFFAPLIETFNLSHFCYFFVTKEGYTACLSSRPDWIEFYLYNNLFLNNPFLKNPILIPEGFFFSRSIDDSIYHQTRGQAKDFGIEDTLVLTFKEKELLRGFSFGLSLNDRNYTLFANEVPLLKRFCQAFLKEAKKPLNELEPVDIKPFLGKSFNHQSNKFSLNPKERIALFNHLNLEIPKISNREKECLLLYLQGETGNSISETLNLSPRTVESYLVNLKNKLNCHNKTELIKKAQELQDYGLLLP